MGKTKSKLGRDSTRNQHTHEDGEAALGASPASWVLIQGLFNVKCISCPESMHLLLMALEIKSILIHLLGNNHLPY